MGMESINQRGDGMTADERKLFIRECALKMATSYIRANIEVKWTSVVAQAVGLADELDRYENEVGK